MKSNILYSMAQAIWTLEVGFSGLMLGWESIATDWPLKLESGLLLNPPMF